MDGWIKLDRSVMESKIFANPVEFKVWAWLMLKASTVDRFLSVKVGKGCTTVELKRGQLIFGRHKAEDELKIDGSSIYRILKRFEDEQVITVKANNQFSIITVNDFIETQSFEEPEILEIEEIEQPITGNLNNQRTTNEQPMSNQRTAIEQQLNTVEESINSKEGLEGLESEKSIEGSAPAGNLFGIPEKPKNGQKKKKQPPPQKKEIVTPWNSCEFLQAWDNWKQFKAGEFKFNYKTPQSEQAALLELSTLSNGSETEAIKIIQQSMAKGWKGLFALKNSENGTIKQINGANGIAGGSSKNRGLNQLLSSLDEDRRAYYNGKNGNGPEI